MESEEFLGIVAGVVSGFTYALPMLMGRHLGGRVSGITQIWWGAGVAALVQMPFALNSGFRPTLAHLPLLIPMGVISLGIAYLLYFLGLQRVKAQVVSVVALLEPVGGILIGWLLFQEYLTPLGAVGSVLVLASIYLISN